MGDNRSKGSYTICYDDVWPHRGLGLNPADRHWSILPSCWLLLLSQWKCSKMYFGGVFYWTSTTAYNSDHWWNFLLHIRFVTVFSVDTQPWWLSALSALNLPNLFIIKVQASSRTSVFQHPQEAEGAGTDSNLWESHICRGKCPPSCRWEVWLMPDWCYSVHSGQSLTFAAQGAY